MARRPASLTQADIARVIRAAKQTGAVEVEVRVEGGSRIVIRLVPSTGGDRPTLHNQRKSSCDGRHAPPSPAASAPANNWHGRTVWYVRVGKGTTHSDSR